MDNKCDCINILFIVLGVGYIYGYYYIYNYLNTYN